MQKRVRFETNMMGPGGEEGDHGRRQRPARGQSRSANTAVQTHSRRTSKECPKNPKILQGIMD
jgi:hypothetical protein